MTTNFDHHSVFSPSKQNREQKRGIIKPSLVKRTRCALELEIVVLQCTIDDGSATRKVVQNVQQAKCRVRKKKQKLLTQFYVGCIG